uniref:Lactase n=1 Tax=Pseudonaja textilis TaxID=8673 RepID=A0A670YZM3_PSETE
MNSFEGVIIKNTFPSGFLWGTSTASFNVEGGWAEDGKGESIWDRYGHQGQIHKNQTADVACDSYRKTEYDVYLLRGLRSKIYKFSISWPRIFANGDNTVKEDGVNVQAYIARSLIDGFEGMSGYSQKFGLHNVNFEDPNRQRTPRKSAYFFSAVIENNGFPNATIKHTHLCSFRSNEYMPRGISVNNLDRLLCFALCKLSI